MVIKLGIETEILNEKEKRGVHKSLKNWLLLLSQSRECEVYSFSKSNIMDIPSNIKQIVVDSKLPLFLWREFVLPKEIYNMQINIFLSPYTAFPSRLKIPVIATIHEVSWRIQNTIAPPIEYGRVLYALKNASRIICVSSSTARDCLKIAKQRRINIKGRLKVLRHAFFPIKADKHFPQSVRPPIIVSISSPLKRKNLFFHLDIVSSLAKTNTSFRYILAGPDGKAKEKLYRHAKKLGILKFVEFPGYISEADKLKILSEARILLHLPLSEGFGFVPLEALSLGCVPVVSEVGGMKELLKSACIFIKDLENPDLISKIVKGVFENHDLREKILKNGKKILLSRDPIRTRERLLKVIKGALGS